MPEQMTPARARVLGDRWETPAGLFLAMSVVFAVLGLGNLAWLSVVLSLVCTRQSTEHRAWRRGYLDGAQTRRDAQMAGDRRG